MNQGCQGHHKLNSSDSNRKCGLHDYTQAAAWFRQAAEQGHAGAQFSLGLMYDNGWGVPEDDAEAAFWYRKAAEQGEVRAPEQY